MPDGLKFRCAVDVANAYPHGLAPAVVAHLMGMSESEVQRIERGSYQAIRTEMQRLKNEERAGAARARERDRRAREAQATPKRRPAPVRRRPAPAPAAPVEAAPPVALVLALCPGCPLRRAAQKRPRPRPVPAPVDPRQMSFSWADAA